MASPASGFLYADGNPSRRPGSATAPAMFVPAVWVDTTALAGLEFLRKPVPPFTAPHPQGVGQALGGSDGNRGGGVLFETNPNPNHTPHVSSFRVSVPPSGGTGAGACNDKPPHVTHPDLGVLRPMCVGADQPQFRTQNTGGAATANANKRKSLGPVFENEPVSNHNHANALRKSPPARKPGVGPSSITEDPFDDDLFDDIDVDAMVRHRQGSLPPTERAAAPRRQADPVVSNADANASNVNATANATANPPPLNGSGLDWQCEHGSSLRDCAWLKQHAKGLNELLIDIEFQLSDEDVVMSNKERKVLEAQRREGSDVVAFASGGGGSAAPATHEMPQQAYQSHAPAYTTQGGQNAYQPNSQPTFQAPNNTGGASFPPNNAGSSFPPNGQSFGGGGGFNDGGGDRFNDGGGDRFNDGGSFGGPFANNFANDDSGERMYPDRPAPGDAAASIPDVHCQFVDDDYVRWNKETFPWSAEVRGELKNTFNARDFRGMQLATINCTLSGNDCLVLMPTGGGKSLCYQLPALVSDGLTVVVSPLVSLIQDQLHHLHEMNIPAAVLGSAETEGQAQQHETYDKLYNGELKLLYLTPEKVARSGKLMAALERLHGRGQLSRIVIDEVHCISSWGHDFRKDYKALRILKNKFPTVPVIGLTATATKRVQDDCVRQLGLTRCVRFFQSFNRVNIMYDVVHKGKNVVDDMLTAIAERHVGRQQRVSSGIVYCFSQKDCETIAEKLNALMVKDKARFKKPPGSREPFALPYHAGIDPGEKEMNQQKWSDGKVPIICATVAFGMGINKPDVRFVFHHSIPKSLEAYHQESGRAGRDGAHSHCTLFYAYGDAQKAKAMLTDSAKKDGAPRAQLESNLSALHSLVSYCENISTCRRTLLLGHFNETFDERQCGGKCDVCEAKNGGACFEAKDVTRAAVAAARLLIGASPQRGQRGPSCSMSILADAFKGSKAKEITKRGYDKLPGFGDAKTTNVKAADVPRLLRALVLQGFFYEESFRSDKGMFSTLTHSVHADQRKCDGLLSGKLAVALHFRLDDKTAAYRRGEANERTHASVRPAVPTATVGPGGGGGTGGVSRATTQNSNRTTVPSVTNVDPLPDKDVFAPENASAAPLDEERYDFLFEALRDAREMLAKKQGSKTGTSIQPFTIIPDRLLDELARNPPPTYAALDKAQVDGRWKDLREGLFLRNHKAVVWRALENGFAAQKGEPPPHEMFSPPPQTRPSQAPNFAEFGFNGTPNNGNGGAQWQRAGNQQQQGQGQQGQQGQHGQGQQGR